MQMKIQMQDREGKLRIRKSDLGQIPSDKSRGLASQHNIGTSDTN